MKEIIIKLKKGKTESIMKAVIQDGMSATSFSDSSQSKMTYESMKRNGEKCLFKDGCIIQFFQGKTEQEIIEMAEAQVNQMAKQVGLEVEITKNEIN